MGAVVSSLGFNQPFLFALIGIMIMLGLAVSMAGSEAPESYLSEPLLTQIRVRPCAPAPRKNA